MAANWQPSASLDTLRARAELLAHIRSFFADREVMEVDTPILSAAATVDFHIESTASTDGRWLRTSPEFAMKRLLAAGSGPIFELGHVFRAGDSGRAHNPEFMMLEWYRPGWDHHQLMDEVSELLASLGAPTPDTQRRSYREAWLEFAGVDPFAASDEILASLARGHQGALDRDGWLDYGMAFVVGPQLGRGAPQFVHDFPASQAALARVRAGDPPLAERFELFWQGLELANGFHELADADEQARRFAADRERRKRAGHVVPPHDENLISALRAGLPQCAGVALGVDRLLMLLEGLPDLASAMPFPADRA